MVSRRIFAALALLFAFALPVQAQSTKAQLNAQIGINFPDNTSNLITPLNARTVALGIVNSIMPTAPVGNGNLACFNGTTGLLQDCGVVPGFSLYVLASQYGMKCDGVTPDDAAFQSAINAAQLLGAPAVAVQAGTCILNNNAYLNTWSVPGTLTVPGLKIVGAGDGVTILNSRVANNYTISVNPNWRAAHQAQFSAAPATTGGTLATNTYYLQITENDGLGNEISVTLPKSYSVTGSTGSVSIPLPALTTGYTYNLYFDANTTPAHYALISPGMNASAIPGNQTVTITAIGAAQVYPTNKVPTWQEAVISDLSIVNTTGAVGNSGVLFFKAGYAGLYRVHMKGQSADGFDIPDYTGDVDGSFDVRVGKSKFDTIAGWCVNAAGNVLELSNFTVDDQTEFNLCGTPLSNLNAAVTISAIQNNSAPVVTTSSPHNLNPGDQIAFNVSGMTLASTWYRVGTTVTNNTFNLVDVNGAAVNTTGLGSFTSGSVSLSWRPPQIANGAVTGGGGCLAWVGLIGTFRNIDFTQCYNTAIYVGESGTNDNLTLEAIDLENTAGKGLYIAALAGGSWNQGELLCTVGPGSTISGVQLGTGFAAGGVQNFSIKNVKYRCNASPGIGFEQYASTNLTPGTYQDTVSYGGITWQTEPTIRSAGFVFPPVPGTAKFSISAQNTAQLIPTGYGSCLPIHLKSPGEWVCYHVPTGGVTGSVTGGLTPFTTYNCFAQQAAANAFPYVIGFSCNSHATALNEGYAVDSADGTKTVIGTATTDGSGNFQSSGAQTSQYPPQGGNVSVFTGIPNGVAGFVTNAAIGSTAAGTNGQIFLGQTGAFPAWATMSGDATISNAGALTLATVNSNVGSFGSATQCVVTTQNAKGLTTAISTVTCAPAIGSIAGLGTGIAAALANNTGSAGAPVLFNGALGSPSSAGTMPAFTLGGAITGASNNITGLTTLSAVNHAAPGALTFQSNGSTFAGSINTAQQWYLGPNGVSPPATSLLTVSGNAAQLPAFTIAGGAVPTVQIAGADGSKAILALRNYGVGGGALAYANAGGTAASPTATTSGTSLGLFVAYGYQTTTNAFGISGGAGLQMTATDNYTSTTLGANLQVYTTPTGTSAIALAATFQASGGFSVGTATDPGTGGILTSTSIKSQGPTSGIGYATGAGGAVTQITSRTTGVTLSKVSGQITLFTAAGSATPATFTVTNTVVAATDNVRCEQSSGTNLYEIFTTAVASGSYNITFFTTGGTASDAPVFNCHVIKGVNSFLMQRDLDPASNDNSPAFMTEKAA